MPYCPRCGTQLTQGANFCHSCGSPVVGSSASGSAGAQPSHQTFDATTTPRVIVRNDSPGSIEVIQGTQSDKVSIDWDIKEPNYLECTASQSGELITINCRARPGEFWPAVFSLGGSRANAKIEVPRQANLDLNCRFGAISVVGVQGNLIADTATGNLTFRNCEGSVEARTHTGLISLENVNGRVSARNSAGSINYSGALASGESWFRTKVGNVEISLSGDPDLTVDASARVGKVTIAPDLKTGQVRFEQYTVGHRVYFTIGSGANRLFAETYTGTISIAVPRGSR